MENKTTNANGADRVLQNFLRHNHQQAMALADASDILSLAAQEMPDGRAPDRYLAGFQCNGLVSDGRGTVALADTWLVGITFPPDYLFAPPDLCRILTLLAPAHPWHPNISDIVPVMCIGQLTAGTDLVSILYRVFELIVWQKVNTHDALNGVAAQWARDPANRSRFPVDRRPLKRRTNSPQPVMAGAQ